MRGFAVARAQHRDGADRSTAVGDGAGGRTDAHADRRATDRLAGRHLRGLALWWVLLIPLGVFAADSTEPRQAAATAESEAQTFDAVSVSASALPTTAAAASQHVTLLDREDLAAMRGLSLSEILSRQAGVVVDRGPASGGFGALYLRGADPSHVVVLIDHVRQNDPLSSRGSAVDLNALSVDDIERIEIVRGNAAVANAEAMAGVIHLFTRRRGRDGAVGAAYGSEGLRSGRAAWSGEHLRLSASHREQGERDSGFGRIRAFNASGVWAVGDAFEFDIAARVSQSLGLGFPDDSGGEQHAALRTLESRRGESVQLFATARMRMPRGELRLQAGGIERESDESSPGVMPGLRDPFGLPPIDTRSDYRRREAQALWSMSAGDTEFTLGVQHQREHGVLDSRIDLGGFVLPARFDLHRGTDSMLAEARWRSRDWIVQGGLRHERSDRGEAGTHPMLSLHYAPAHGHGQWGLSIARSAKAPSFYALGHPLVGNAQLRPERAVHRELHYASAAEAAWPVRIGLFSARYRDLVDLDAGPPPRLVNRSRIAADGVEWRGSHNFDGYGEWSLEGSWLRVRTPGNVPLRHRPRLQWAARWRLPLNDAREVSMSVQHIGRRFDSSIPTGDCWLAPTTTLDLALRQTWGPAVLTLALDDVFDRRREDIIGDVAPGRRWRLAVQWRMH